MKSIGFYVDPASIEPNALDGLQQYARKPFIGKICAFTDIHFCQEKSLPVGVAFQSRDYCYPLVTGKDIGCGVMYLKVDKQYWLKPFDKKSHYAALNQAHHKMTDDGLGGGNHFLSLEEDEHAVYIICHTGTRDRGIALYQRCYELTRQYSLSVGEERDYLPLERLNEAFLENYTGTIHFGHERRKNFCVKTLVFLQNANYISCLKSSISRDYLKFNFRNLPTEGTLHGTPYKMEDSVHNALSFAGRKVIHRKGSTALEKGKTVVIPLSMSRGSLLVTAGSWDNAGGALYSCAHGAGRRLSRFDAMKHWKTVLKEKHRKAYRERFPEMLDRRGRFPSGYIQEMDFAYKEASAIMAFHPYLNKVTETRPVATIKYSEI